MSDLSHEALIFRPFVKDQSCQCNLNRTYQPLRKSYSLESFPEFSTEHETNPHYCFSSLDIKKPSGAKPSLGLTFDRDGNRPSILRSIDSKGCFANVKEISSGDRLVFVDNALYGVKTLADVSCATVFHTICRSSVFCRFSSKWPSFCISQKYSLFNRNFENKNSRIFLPSFAILFL